jgi:hypothetical protein
MDCQEIIRKCYEWQINEGGVSDKIEGGIEMCVK